MKYPHEKEANTAFTASSNTTTTTTTNNRSGNCRHGNENNTMTVYDNANPHNRNDYNSLIPPHLSCLHKNEVLARCLLVRHRLPEIDPAKLATLREQLQRERDEALYQTIQS